jgi:hypothetical protein
LTVAWEQEGERVAESLDSYCAAAVVGDDAEAAAQRYLHDYYGHTPDYADWALASAVKDADGVREFVRTYADAGCAEVIFFPCNADPGQVDLLADALA